MAYYIAPLIVMIVLIAAVTAMVIHALNKKGDVSAGLQLNRIGFTLNAKDKLDKLNS